MKKTFFIFIIAILSFSCNDDDHDCPDNEFVGSWKLIEVLADPGDGSGTFIPVESSRTLTFKNSGIITTNTSLCNPYSDEIRTSGSYDVLEKKIYTNCEGANIPSISFKMENEYLILDFFSLEGYSQKFERVE